MDSTVDQDFDTLPVEDYKQEILKSVRENQVVICIGETGSGKTTQIPQFLLDNGFCKRGIVGVTQPRRIAAISVTERICDERKSRVGEEVGYAVRFDDKTSSRTKIKFMTDGIMIRESLSDSNLSQYSVIMLDEAHERSLNTDILFGLLKAACAARPDLKVIVTSATLDADKFRAYFNNCPIIRVPGRVFPVDIYHSKTKQVMTANGPANNSYVQSAVDVVMKIHRKDDDGHILVFLTGQEEIEKACALLRVALQEDPQDDRELIILPLYAALPNDVQSRVFKKPTALVQSNKLLRKCVIATNIAETSITVPHVRYVVDAGFVKQKVFDPARGMESLIIVPVSKIAALQRAGRAGRTGPGQCYRLYSSDCFDQMMDETVPEIQRTNLSNTILYLKALGIADVLSFDFLDPPSVGQVLQALVELHKLGALDDFGAITALGRQMSTFPLDPHISRMLIEAGKKECQCLQEIVVICAMLCVENVWMRPQGARRPPKPQDARQQREQRNQREQIARTVDEERADIAHAGLRHAYGDFLSLLNVFNSWEKAGFSMDWCSRNYINGRSMKTARKIKDHLSQDADKARIAESYEKYAGEVSLEKRICNAVTAGFYMNAAVRCSNESVYKCIGDGDELQLVHLSPQSAFSFVDPPEYIIYQELMHSTKLYMRTAGRVSKSVLKMHQRSWNKVPPEQLSSGQVVVQALQAQGSQRKRSREEDTETKDSCSDGIADASQSSDVNEAVNAAKLRYLSRKGTAPPGKRR